MLTRIQIHNFRTCSDVRLAELGPMALLIGPNGAGKTNILKAVELAARVASNNSGEAEFAWWNAWVIRLEIQLNGSTYLYEFSLNLRRTGGSMLGGSLDEDLSRQQDDGSWGVLVERKGERVRLMPTQHELKIAHRTPALPAVLANLPQHPNASEIREVVQFLETVRYYPMDEPSTPTAQPDVGAAIADSNYRKWISGAMTKPDSVVLRLLELSRERQAEFEELKQILGPDGLGLLDDIRIQTTQDDNPIHRATFTPLPVPAANEDRSGGYSELPHGTRRVLRILTSILYDRSSVYLLEQPEDSVHPALLHKLMAVLRSYSDSSQFIVTSHSPMVFDLMSPEEIRLVTMRDGKTEVRSLEEPELDAAESFLRHEGSLSDFLETVQGG